jgi:hypothetical protein
MMGGIGRVLATGVVLTATVFALSGRAAVIPDGVIIRVYDNAGVLAGDRARAISRAREILTRAELDVEFRDCVSRTQLPAACATPPAPGELIVRLARGAKRPDPSRRHDSADVSRALGHSMIDTATGTGTLATIFIDRIEAMARQARTDRLAIVGRVMAHEIGHLLLGTNAHSKTGLMREIWTLAELTRNQAQDWMFSDAQSDRLREARLLGRRATTAAARAGETPGAGG